MRKIVVLILSLLLLAGCAPAAGSAYPNENAPAYINPPTQPTAAVSAAASGIEGQVLLGPACPVAQEGNTCPDQPYQATLTIKNPQGELIFQFQTNPDGTFRIPLPSGNYILHPENTGRYPTAADQEFTVVAGEFTQIAITYDSGIR
jgi:hypothetical protein